VVCQWWLISYLIPIIIIVYQIGYGLPSMIEKLFLQQLQSLGNHFFGKILKRPKHFHSSILLLTCLGEAERAYPWTQQKPIERQKHGPSGPNISGHLKLMIYQLYILGQSNAQQILTYHGIASCLHNNV
jgi:hypothetical protein